MRVVNQVGARRANDRPRGTEVGPFDAPRKLHADNYVSTAATAASLHATRHVLLGAPIPEEGR